MSYKRISPLPVNEGGTGAQTFTNHGVLLGNTTSAFTSITPGTDGQIIIGNTATGIPAFATITAGTNIALTLGANALTIATSGPASFTWSVITANQAFTVNNGFICNKASALVLTLPTVAAVGDLFEVTGINTALGWQIAQNANQQIFFGNVSTTLGAGGSLASSAIRDGVRLVCVVANLSFNVIYSIGNITVV